MIKQFFKKLAFFYQSRPFFWGITSAISIAATLYFYTNNNQNLADYDAIARLNIARKLFDSITPGVGQLGGIWLPFPEVFFTPFVLNNFLWHSGLAGSIVSGIAFIIAAVFLQKTAFLLTKNVFISLVVWFMFVSNINILLLQSMAMSESFFLCFLILTVHFLMKWTITLEKKDLLYTACALIFLTLTRYEGYFIFISVLVVVILNCILIYGKKEGREKGEGMIFLFLSIASYGIFLWCLYCALFYKDPLYWLHIYTPTTSVALKKTPLALHMQQTNMLFSAFVTYSEATLWTNGIITTLIGITGYTLLFVKTIQQYIQKKSLALYFPLSTISTLLFCFLVFGYEKGFIPNVEYPPITIAHLLSKSFNMYSHSNIRYGIIMAPLILLLGGYLASKSKIMRFFVVIAFGVQFFTTFFTPLMLQFSFPLSWSYSIIPSATWLSSHYDNGHILISAKSHENFMFQTKLPYKDFIYEGSRTYWTTSLNDPRIYARWVVYDDKNTGTADYVWILLTEHARSILQTKYRLIYNNDGYKIYQQI